MINVERDKDFSLERRKTSPLRLIAVLLSLCTFGLVSTTTIFSRIEFLGQFHGPVKFVLHLAAFFIGVVVASIILITFAVLAFSVKDWVKKSFDKWWVRVLERG